MEPLLVTPESRFTGVINDLTVELAAKAAGFRRSLPEGVLSSLADLVRAMNCYYSNLIEGHDTHPVDIERALQQDYSSDTHKRNLQLEARAHINVQAWIDQGGLTGRALTMDGIREIHRRFGELLPDELLWTEDPDSGERSTIKPGALREQDVKIGRHVPVSPVALPRFLQRFEQVYSRLSKSQTIAMAAASHHRLLWIHPFVDGNGRVTRLMSHAILLETLDTGGVWSIARGLARNVGKYKTLLANCDLPRRNALDGRGHLSEEALVEFTLFFLRTCLDQIDFMESLVQPERLRHRLLSWAAEEVAMGALLPKSELVLEALLYRGLLPRGDVPNLIGVGERQARRVVSALTKQKVLTSTSRRAPLSLAFPPRLAPRLMPGLFPDK
ncbi:MAG TPA: Fic family protein [Desulfobulbus sp.]|nr:Fic family protein [Desulfobulbus sp.]